MNAVDELLTGFKSTILLDTSAYGLEQRRNVRQMLRHLPPESKILDVGCGFGAPATDAGLHFSVQSCDIPPASADQRTFVEAVMRLRHVPLRWIENGVLPYTDSTFDGVLLYAVLEHVPDKEHLLAECRRVLRPGGVVFVFRAVNRVAFAEKLAALLGIVNHGSDTVTAAELRHAVSAVGLNMLGMGTHGWLPEKGLSRWPIYWLNLLLARLPIVKQFSHDFWLVAQR